MYESNKLYIRTIPQVATIAVCTCAYHRKSHLLYVRIAGAVLIAFVIESFSQAHAKELR